MRRPSRTAWTALVGLLASGLLVVGTAAPAAADEVAERPADGVFSLQGHGWGHGRGMSQWGAQGAASQGLSAVTIVSTYYPGTARTVLAPPRSIVSVWPGCLSTATQKVRGSSSAARAAANSPWVEEAETGLR